ncbi:RDD family protein [Acetobacter musti]|uniref:RDD family protein n=1 Tax=Acetobacter musti TaxID=864732 RepID=A0ABX0JUQ1_9PROT|nr:RDD family protein [Acetobacter musti]NHN86562.1 RDD family protein [Acetobacter musti]
MSNSLPPGWGQNAWSTKTAGPADDWTGGEQSAFGYAGFWIRTAAALLDWFILSMAGYFLRLLAVPTLRFDTIEVPGDTPSYEVAYRTTDYFYSVPFPHTHIDTSGNNPVFFLLTLAWAVAFEASAMRGTPGKWVLGLQVCDLNGQRISLLRSLARNLVKIFVSFPFLCVGVIMVAFTARKQGLHDMVAGTLVLRRQRIVRFGGQI